MINEIDEISNIDIEVMLDYIYKLVFESIKVKAEVVFSDEREFSLRNFLNFGYFIGYVYEVILIL